jgi:hypothetical protein
MRPGVHVNILRPFQLVVLSILGQAEIADGEIEPPLDLPIGVLGQVDRPGHGDALKPGGDVDAVAHQIAVAFLDHVAQMNSDPELDPALGRQRALR